MDWDPIGDLQNGVALQTFGNVHRTIFDPMTAVKNLITKGDAWNWNGEAPNSQPTVDNGGELDASGFDKQREDLDKLIAQLQQQAITGDPAALQQLHDATQKTMQGQSAMGATSAAQHGVGGATAMRNIADQRAHTQQAEIGQEAETKAAGQQAAQGKLADVIAQRRANDIAEAQAKLQAERGIDQAHVSQKEQNAKTFQDMSGGLVGGLFKMIGLSGGGDVDGHAMAAGDSPKNDVVPAMLSPGEIVLPRSVTMGPNPEDRAAAFVAAVKRGHGPPPSPTHHYDEGGNVNGPIPQGTDEQNAIGGLAPLLIGGAPSGNWSNTGNTLLSSFGLNPSDRGHMPARDLDMKHTKEADAMLRNPDAVAFGGSPGLMPALQAAAQGQGPSTINPQLQRATDKNLADSVTGMSMARNLAGILRGNAQTGQEQQKLAGESAMAKGMEDARAQSTLAGLLQHLSDQDLLAAQIQQRDRLNATLVNMGLDAQHRAQIINQLGAAGAGLASAKFGGRKKEDDSGYRGGEEQWKKEVANSYDTTGSSGEPDGYINEAPEDSSASMPADWGNSGEMAAAHGGEVPFPEAIKRRHFADGGPVPAYLSAYLKPSATFDGSGLTPAPVVNYSGAGYGHGGYQGAEKARQDAITADILSQHQAWVANPENAKIEAAKAKMAAQPAWYELGATGPAISPEEWALAGKPGFREKAQEQPEEGPKKVFKEPGAEGEKPSAEPAKPGGAPSVGGGMPNRWGGVDSALKAEQNAATATGEAAAAAGLEQEKLANQSVQELAQRELAATKLRTDYQLHRQEQEEKLRQAMDKFANAEIDPDHYWATKSTGDKIVAGIGLALGGLGAGNTGVNQAVAVINHAIDRDIEAQKANLAKKGQAVQHESSMLANMRADFSDDAQADAAAKMAYLQRAQMMAEGAKARSSGAIQQKQAEQLSAQLATQYAAEKAKFQQQGDIHAQQFALQRQQMALRAAQPQVNVHKEVDNALKRFAEKYPEGKGAMTSPVEFGRDREALKAEVGGMLSARGMPKESVDKKLEELLPQRRYGAEEFNNSLRRTLVFARGSVIGKNATKGGGGDAGEAEP